MRFHTFNKRVMVYDVSRNFIGDTHWREGDVLQDGDELELDKGVMIQVGEASGRMEQDLTELLERRKPNQALSREARSGPKSSPDTLRSTAATYSELRPKSLNALLGTAKGTPGRAVLPHKSPFAEAHPEGKENIYNERQMKKRKLNYKDRDSTTTPCRTHMSNIGDKTNQNMHNTQNGPRKIVKPQAQQDREVILIASEDENVNSPNHAIGRVQRISQCRGIESAAKRRSSPLLCSPPTPQSTRAPEDDARAISSKISPIERRARKPAAQSSATEAKPINPLRPASRKSRKKLMYKDLLPNLRTSPNNDFDKSGNGVLAASKNELSHFHRAQQDQLEKRLQTRPYNAPEGASDLPLSVGQDDDEFGLLTELHSTTVTTSKPPAQSLYAVPKEQLSSGRIPKVYYAPESPKAARSRSHEKPVKSYGFTKSTAATPPNPAIPLAPSLSDLDHQFLKRPPPPPNATKSPTNPPPALPPSPPPPPKTHPCPQSPNPSPAPATAIAPHPRLHTFRSPLKKAFSAPTPLPAPLSPPKRTLDRSISDITHSTPRNKPYHHHHPIAVSCPASRNILQQTLQAQQVTNTNANADGARYPELGPWSREAFDLFGEARPSVRAAEEEEVAGKG